jgi:hypothetical protein
MPISCNLEKLDLFFFVDRHHFKEQIIMLEIGNLFFKFVLHIWDCETMVNLMVFLFIFTRCL